MNRNHLSTSSYFLSASSAINFACANCCSKMPTLSSSILVRFSRAFRILVSMILWNNFYFYIFTQSLNQYFSFSKTLYETKHFPMRTIVRQKKLIASANMKYIIKNGKMCKHVENLPFTFVSGLRCFWEFSCGWTQTFFWTFQIFFKQLNTTIESGYFRFGLYHNKGKYFELTSVIG